MISAGEVHYLSSHHQAFGRDINLWKGMAICFFIQVNTKLRSILFGIYNNEAVRYRLRQNDERQLKEFIVLHVAKEIKTLKTT